MNCSYCNSICIKKGFQKTKQQKYRCTARHCGKYQQLHYTYNACKTQLNPEIIKLVQRGNGIRDIAFIKEISCTTAIKRIRKIASFIHPPAYHPFYSDYQMDEMHTIIWENNKKRDVYLSYAINKQTKEVANFTIGRRDKETLGIVINTILCTGPRTISTDRFRTYPCIIPKKIHVYRRFKINHVERNHLTVRTQQKRLSDNRLCESKKEDMLEAYLKIYFWG